MALSLIRGKYVICKIHSRTAADVIEDGAVVHRDGTILAVGPYAALAQHYQPDETFGSAEHVVMPGLVNSHHHVGLTPFQLGRRTIRSSSGSPAVWRRGVSIRISIRSIPQRQLEPAPAQRCGPVESPAGARGAGGAVLR